MPDTLPRPDFQSQSVVVTPYSGQDELNLLDLWAIMVREKRFIVRSVLFFTTVAVAAAFLMTPIYRAEVLLLPVIAEDMGGKSSMLSKLGGMGGAAAMLGIGNQSDNTTVFASAKLQSKIFIESFLRDENLLPVLFWKKWDADKKEWKKSTLKSLLGIADEPEPPSWWEAVNYFDKNVFSVTEDKKTGLVTLTIDWKDREPAVRWANLMVDRINQYLRDLAIQDARKSLEFLNGESEKAQVVGVRDAIASLQEDQMKQIMQASVKTAYAFAIVDPAVVPPASEFIKPKRVPFIVFGFFGGGFIGAFAAFFRDSIRRQKMAMAEGK